MRELTRNDLIKIIYHSKYCPKYSCDDTDCMECAEKALKEYEDKIRESTESED